MVQNSPFLSQRIQRNTSNLAVLSTASFMRPVSADTRISGPRPHMVIFDEVHEMRDATLIDKLSAGFKGRRQKNVERDFDGKDPGRLPLFG
jgi:phage terminase large subunit-like protein